MKPGKKIEQLIADERWRDARAVILKELEKDSESHWLWDRLAVTFYEERDYESASKHIETAYQLAPACPLVLWDYAGTKDAMGDCETAIAFYFKIAKRMKGRPRDECALHEGPQWRLSLLVDCIFRVGNCCRKLNRTKQAVFCFEKYVEMVSRFKKLKSIYTLDDALKHLDQLDGDMEENIAHAMKEVMDFDLAAL